MQLLDKASVPGHTHFCICYFKEQHFLQLLDICDLFNRRSSVMKIGHVSEAVTRQVNLRLSAAEQLRCLGSVCTLGYFQETTSP